MPKIQLNILYFCAWIAMFMVLSGCSNRKSELSVDPLTTEPGVYHKAQNFLRTKNYSGAIELYKFLESRFPFGRYTKQAQLENIYAHYMSQQLEETKEVANRFIERYPNHPKIANAYYLHGMASFASIHAKSILFSSDPSERDSIPIREAFNSFQRLTKLYPNSEYAKDAKQRMIYLRNVMANHEIKTGHFYLDRKAYIAAINRGRYVVENFSKTEAVKDALVLMIDSYLYLNLQEQAKDTIRILRQNYPNHPNFTSDNVYRATKRKNVANRSLLNVLSFGFLAPPKIPPPIVISTEQ